MKITRIQADGILGITSMDIKPATAIQLFSGSNGSGKSSLRDCVEMAIAQETVRGVSLKKEYEALVNEGAKQGGVLVTMNNDNDQTFAFNMPSGKFSGMEISESMRVSLNGQRFAEMTTDERRTFVFDLTKCKPSIDRVRAGMLQRKCDVAKTEAVLPLLRTGFPSVCDHAKGKATEAKGAWRVTTGETYGAVKAQSWSAPMPDAPDESAADGLRTSIALIEADIAKMNQALGEIKTQAATANSNAAKRAALEDSVKKLPGLLEQLMSAKADLAKYEPTVVALRARAGGTARIGLVHDMADFIDGIDVTDSAKAVTQAKLLAAYAKEHGAVGAKSDPEAQSALPEHEKGLTVMQNRVKNLQRDVDAAQQAKGQFDALAPDSEAVDVSGEIAEVTALIDQKKAQRSTEQNKLLDIEAAVKNRASAEKKTKDAAAHHADVVAWTLIAEALAPDGIPSELLAQALAPVNSALEQAAIDTDWMQVKIGPDMEITAAGRPRSRLSESEQWRTDAMIAQVVSEISGLKILMLDRMDVLDLTGRQQLLEWLDVLAVNDLLDTALLFATLKQAPHDRANTVQSYWVEDGAIVEWEKSRAYAEILAAQQKTAAEQQAAA